MTELASMPPKQSPERCSECGKLDVYPTVMPYTARVKHDGTLYTFPIQELRVHKCRSCSDVLFDSVTDDQISQALRDHLRLLSPQEIRKRIGALGLMQKDFAAQIPVAPETLSRWLSGAYIQSRAYDKLMRLFFAREESTPKKLKAGEVTLKDGELTPWSHPASYQLENTTPLDIAENLMQGDFALAA